MKIGIQTWGSDGDILPFMALAEGLRNAGHEVTVAYTSVDNKDYSAYAIEGGFESFRVFGDFTEGVQESVLDIVQTNDPFKQFVRVMETFFDPAVEAMYAASTRLCEENELVIGHMMIHTLLTACELSGRPRVSVALAPMAIRTRHSPLFGPDLGTSWNRLTWWLGDVLGTKKLFGPAAAIRQRAGLPPIKSLQSQLYISRELTLVASSPTLSPRPPDWEAHIQLCGDWNFNHLKRHIPMPEGLEAFLAAGTPPVYISFGSVELYQAELMDQLMREAVELAGCRAVLQSSLETADSANLFYCQRAPHAAVFPSCAAVIHHGGAGTTHSSLRAGCPTIVVEHAFDQIFWGKEVEKRGVGKLLHRNRVTPQQLAQAIKAVLGSSEMKHRAQRLGEQMRRENGVGRAIELIEARFGA